MSKKRQKQFGAISIFFRTLITAFSIFVAIATILGCVKITQNAEETIEVGANVQNATIKWLFWDVSNKAVISINTVDTTKIGDYKISYIFGIRILNQTIHVVDTQPPIITLKGDAVVQTKNIENYREPGYEALDNYDGDLTRKVQRKCVPDEFEVGKYIFIYSVSDSSGNTATIERIAYLQDNGY